MGLAGRIALVTGAGQGIGAAIATRLARDGAMVVVNDINGSVAHGTASLIKSAGYDAVAHVADVSSGSEVERMFVDIERDLGRVDILVNNVGIVRDSLVHEMREEDWDAVIQVNLRSYFLCCRGAVRSMLKQHYGRIVSISSRAWLGGFGQSNYSASKGAIVSLTRTLAIELAAKGITANCVAPGLIDSPLFRSFRSDVQERLMKMQPSGTIGQPDDVANAVSFFVSDASHYVTGQTMFVCGGKSLGTGGLG